MSQRYFARDTLRRKLLILFSLYEEMVPKVGAAWMGKMAMKSMSGCPATGLR